MKYFLLLIIILPFVLADTSNNEIFNASGINTNFTVNLTNKNLTFASSIVNTNFIYFEEINMTNGDELLQYDLNITLPNRAYYYTDSVIDIPYISLSEPENVIVLSNIATEGTIIFNVNSCQIEQIIANDATYVGNQVQCSNNLVTINSAFPNQYVIEYTANEPQNMGGGSSNTPAILKNPKNINVIYTEKWKRNSEAKITIQIYNQNDNLYTPTKPVKVEYDIANIELLSSKKTDNDETEINFKIDSDAELGKRDLTIIVEDEEELKKTIQIEIIRNNEPIPQEKENQNIVFWVIAFITALFIILILSAFIIEKNKNNRNKSE